MKRPSLALALICKNEVQNLPILFKSIRGCFDVVHVTDTGSTDGTIEYLTDLVKLGMDKDILGCPLKLHHFGWVNDFAKARNASFAPVKTDFVMWMDCDDVMENRDAFIHWRNHAMALGSFWLASYYYVSNDKGESICSFARERVVRVSKKPTWKCFVHEGILPTPEMMPPNYAITWQVRHRRTLDDVKKDKTRNLKLFEANRVGLENDPRMFYYYGKELYETGDPAAAIQILKEAVTMDLPVDDRILGIQYAAMACFELGSTKEVYYQRAMAYAQQGLTLAPDRAEFHVVIADCFSRRGLLQEAIPFYLAATGCRNKTPSGGKWHGALFQLDDSYGIYPREQLAKIYFNFGEFEKSREECDKALALGSKSPEIAKLSEMLAQAMKQIDVLRDDLEQTDDIVITTPPVGAYAWDEDLYKTKGLGGSETAAVEVARWIKKKTGRKVIIYNPRDSVFMAESGVEYRPIRDVLDYFSNKKPAVHIQWRHNNSLTKAPTYLWCHDLTTATVEREQNFTKMLCLSQFHKDYVVAMQGVDPAKIVITRNGINPKRFKEKWKVKNHNKVIFPSSPDRGLDRAMLIMDKAREKCPELELHVYYGLENLEKYGMKAMADHLKGMMATRPWVKYHGNVDQTTLAKEMKEAVVWLYPANFIESFCITVLESVCAGVYPLVRDIGALQHTVKPFHDQGMATLLDLNAETDDEIRIWAEHLVEAIQVRAWENVQVNPEDYSWEGVADEFLEIFGLKERTKWRSHNSQAMESTV